MHLTTQLSCSFIPPSLAKECCRHQLTCPARTVSCHGARLPPVVGHRCVCTTGTVRHEAVVQSTSPREMLFSDMSLAPFAKKKLDTQTASPPAPHMAVGHVVGIFCSGGERPCLALHKSHTDLDDWVVIDHRDQQSGQLRWRYERFEIGRRFTARLMSPKFLGQQMVQKSEILSLQQRGDLTWGAGALRALLR